MPVDPLPAAQRWRRAAANAVLVLMLAGCAATRSYEQPPAAAPVATDATPVSAGVAQTLEAAPAGTQFAYGLGSGAGASLVLGPLYQSVRGVPCRLARAGPAASTPGRPDSYPFCRFGNQWYAMKAVVISGY